MNLYRQRVDGTTNAGTQVTVSLPVISPGEVVEVYSAGVENASGEAVTVQLGVLEGSDFFPLQAKSTVAQNDAAVVTNRFFLFEGQNLAANVTGAAAAGKVSLYANGIDAAPDPPDPPVATVLVEPESKKPAGY